MSAKWREQLRAGNINSADKKRLLDNGILNYSKEASGLEKGNAILSKKHGLFPKNLRQLVNEDLVPAIKAGDRIATGRLLKVMKSTMDNWSPAGMIGETTETSFVLYSPYFNNITKNLAGEALRGMKALCIRHELNEILCAQKLLLSGITHVVYFCNSHISPEVITKESYDISMLCPEVQNKMDGYRIFENHYLKVFGASYGKTIPKKITKRLIKEFTKA